MSRQRTEEIRAKLRARPGAQQRLESEVSRMERVLELEKLRTSAHVTQAQLADVLGVSQRRVSQIEHSPDLQLQTIANYVAACGGTLEVNAVIDGDRIPLYHV